MRTVTPVKFTIVPLSQMPSPQRARVRRCRFDAAINTAALYKNKGVVISTAGMAPNAVNTAYSGLISAIKVRGFKTTIKVARRGATLWIHRIK